MKRSEYKKYPYYCGDCKQCGNKIMALYPAMVKPNRTFCSRTCKTTYMNLHNNPLWKLENRKKLSEARLKTAKDNYQWSEERRIKWAKSLEGSNSRFWKGGLVDENKKHRNSVHYRLWREKVFKRDDYTCQVCTARNGNGFTVHLNADHIKSWSKYPRLRFNVDNGRTLCLTCHLQTDNFGYKAVWNN